jgi:DNA replication protein DnaD
MENMDKTWIKLYRQSLENDLYNIKPFDRFHAWIDLLLLAEYKTHKKLWRGKMTDFKRGDVNLSIEKLAASWGWSRGKTVRFLNNLNDLEMISLNVHRNRTIITLVNWDLYQNGRHQNGHQNEHQNEHQDDISDDTSNDQYLKNSIKNSKEKEEEPAAQFSNSEEEDVNEWFESLEDESEKWFGKKDD